MGFFDRFKSKKKKAGSAAGEADALLQFDGSELDGLTPPETRYTQEYQDFLAEQEAAVSPVRSAAADAAEAAEAVEAAAAEVEAGTAEVAEVVEAAAAEVEADAAEGAEAVEAAAAEEVAVEAADGADHPAVAPDGFCAGFERCSTSLIEEPETCDVCVFFSERDSTCRRPERAQ